MILHIAAATVIAALAASLAFTAITVAVYEMEDTSDSNPGFAGIAIVLSFVLMLLPALLIVTGLVVAGVKPWWAYVLGGVLMAFLVNLIFIGEMNTRLLAFSGAAGVIGGLAAWFYLRYGSRLLEVTNA